MALMRSVVLERYDPDFNKSLGFTDSRVVPTAKPGEVVVKVAMAASNPVDYKIASGNLQLAMKRTFPAGVGSDFAGTVHSIPDGGDGNGLKVGDRVAGFDLSMGVAPSGSFAEYTVVRAKYLAKIPASVSFEDAASLPLAVNTSYQVLTGQLGVKNDSGYKLLILGGSTATGLFAIQIARDLGCSEIVCTSSSVDLCKSLGATEVINYKTAKWEDVLKGRNFDGVYDCVGGKDSWPKAQKVMKSSGAKFVTIAGDTPDVQIGLSMIPKAVAMMANRSFWAAFGYPKYMMYMGLTPDADKGLAYYLDLMDRGKAITIIDPSSPYEFSKDGAAKMFEKQRSATSKGKLVMKVQ